MTSPQLPPEIDKDNKSEVFSGHKKVSMLQLLNIGIFLGGVVFALWFIRFGDEPQASPTKGVERELIKSFIISVIKNSKQTLPTGKTAIDIGKQAFDRYSGSSQTAAKGSSPKTSLHGTSGGPPQDPPPPGDPNWEFEFPCTLKSKGSWLVSNFPVIGVLEVKPPKINVCIDPIYYCVGVALLRCPADQDMSCAKNALHMKCIYY